jgi:hypothetical protein
MTRVRIGADTIAAAYRAHMAAAHAGQVGRGPRGGACPTCRRYAAALTLARTTPPERP